MGHNSASLKDNCTLFAPTPYFQARAILWCHLNFSPGFHCCHSNEFWDKIDYNSVCVKNICKISAFIEGFQRWAIECCQPNYSLGNPHCHGNEIWDKIGYNSAYGEHLRNFCVYRGVSGMGHWMMQSEFFPERSSLPWQRNLGHNG